MILKVLQFATWVASVLHYEHVVHYLDFSKKPKILFLVNLHHFHEHYEAIKDEEPMKGGK